MRLTAAALSDQGLRREANEDSYLVRPDLGLYVVADGMGGHAAGEVASRLAIDAIESFIARTVSAESGSIEPDACDPAVGVDGNRLILALKQANRDIGEQSTLLVGTRGMATTSVVLLVPQNGAAVRHDATNETVAFVPAAPGAHAHPAGEPETLSGLVAHVGDSRLYLWRDGQLDRLTRDHSWVEEQVVAGALSTSEARVHPWRNLVTRALSGGPDPDIDLLPVSLEPRDRVLLCSDGLTSVVGDDVICEVMGRPHDGQLDALCQMLVDAANAAGGPDNITVVVVEVA
jgi:serine/threonine protein phosphatase PrpC